MRMHTHHNIIASVNIISVNNVCALLYGLPLCPVLTAEGTEQYNSDVTVAEPFLRLADIESGVFQIAGNDLWNTGML
jgi:hypothetical protein